MNKFKNIIIGLKKVDLKEGFFICVSLIAVFYFPVYMSFLIIKDVFNFYYSNYSDINAIFLMLIMFGIPIAIVIKLNGFEIISNLFSMTSQIIKYVLAILFIVWIISSWNNLLDMAKLQWIGFIIILLLITLIRNNKQ